MLPLSELRLFELPIAWRFHDQFRRPGAWVYGCADSVGGRPPARADQGPQVPS